MEKNDQYFSDGELSGNILRAKEIVEDGQIFIYKNFLEETVEQCIEFGKYKDAHFILKQLTHVSPFDSDLWFRRGLCLSRMHRPDLALRAYDKSLSMNPSDAETMIEKAFTCTLLKKYGEAEELLHDALELEPDNELIFFRFGKLFQKRRDYKKAIRYFRRAIEVDPTFSDAVFQTALCYEYMNENSEALKVYDSYLDIEPDCEIGWFNRAIVLEHLHLYDMSVNSYEISLALDEKFTDAWFNLGNLLADLGKHQQAIQAFKKVIQLDNKDETAYYNLGTIYEELQQLKTAIQYFSQAIKLDPYYHEAYIGRGQCLLQLGYYEGALFDFRNALATNKPESWISLEKQNGILDEKRLRSIYELREKTEKYPDENHTRLELVNQLISSGKYKTAEIEIHNVFLRNPESALAYYNLARSCFIKAHNKKAFYYLKRAFELKPELKDNFKKTFPMVASSNLMKMLLGYRLL